MKSTAPAIRSARRAPFIVVMRIAAATLATAALGLLASAPALAHASLISSNPTEGASLTALPSTVSFTFDENISTPAFVAVTAPDGSSIVTGSPQITNATISQAIKPIGERGIYTMSYRVVSDDGHPVSDSLTFTLTTGRQVTQQSAGSSLGGADNGSSGSFWSNHSTAIVIAAVVIVLGLALLIGSGAAKRPRSEAS